MCKELETWLEEERTEGEARGKAIGEARGKESERMNSIRAIMDTANVSAEGAMKILKIDPALWKKYLALL